MHLADPERHFWGGHAVVGAHLSLAVGLAVAEQYKETGGVVLCYFGDGATNIGYFHESLNLAGVWDLPIVLICENNEYGMGTTDRTRLRRRAHGRQGQRVQHPRQAESTA